MLTAYFIAATLAQFWRLRQCKADGVDATDKVDNILASRPAITCLRRGRWFRTGRLRG
jgi:hypothetical protein